MDRRCLQTMTSRERFLLALNHREPDRIPVCDTPWETTIARWHAEGLPADTHPHGFFGYEWASQTADTSARLPEVTLEETDEYRIIKDAWGATTRVFKGRESVPELLDYTITTRDLWLEYKPLFAWDDTRVNWEQALATNRSLRESGLFSTYSAGFGFDRVQRFAGAPTVLMAMIEDPDWIADMFETIGDLIIASCAEMIARGMEFDGAFIWNDMGYRNGPFFSPALYRRLEFPVQKRLCDFFHSHGMPVILHTDGNVRSLIPGFIEAGFDCLQPIESKAGMDLVELKHQYGDRLAFMGGIDVRAMADPDPLAIEREISRKIPVAMRGGGYIYHSDHSVPDNVCFERYQRVMELVRHYGDYGRLR